MSALALLHGVVVLLAWQLQPGGIAPPRRSVRAIPPTMQAGGAAAARAMEMLGKMGMQAASEATPGEIPITKEFEVGVRIRHDRIIEAAEGGAVVDYLRLPVDQYAIYDARLMRKVGPDDGGTEGGGGEVFELSLPTMRPREGALMPAPMLRVRVTPEPDQITLQSIGANLFGDAEKSALPANVTAEQMAAINDQMRDVFNIGLNTTLSWSDAKRRAPVAATRLRCRTDVRLKVRLPPPFTRAPRPLVQGAIGIIMRFVGNLILPRFAGLLETDYQRWCNGTRDLTRGLGSLALDDDGYLVVPPEVEQKMQSAPGVAAAGFEPQPQQQLPRLDADGADQSSSKSGGGGPGL